MYDKIINSAESHEEVKEMYEKVIKDELKRFNCETNPDPLIFSDVNIDGLLYKSLKRIAKSKA